MARVLIVDDEPNILVVMGALFKCAGYDVVTVPGGDKAIEPLKTLDFDLLVSDVRMDPVDGIQLLKLAKKVRPRMPVIMVTAFDMPQAKLNAMKLGAHAYLKKPFDNQELLRLAGEALSKSAQAKKEKAPQG